MNRKVTVEVIIDNLHDNKIYNEPIEVTRKGEKITIVQKLLQKGDKYETDIEHAEYLESLKAVKIIKNGFTKSSEE